MTTNYDNRLELALEQTISGCSVEASGLEDVTDWWNITPSANAVNVSHLHGYLPPAREEIGPVILTEPYYLKYGDQVRAAIRTALDRSLVLFVGISLTDPNFIGSLHGTANVNAFALLVPDTPEPEGTTPPGRLALAYSVAQARYLYNEFGVQTVILKSYAQVTQCVNELAIAADSNSSYNLPGSDVPYGHRLRRALSSVHRAVRMRDAMTPASGIDAMTVSDALEEALHQTDGPLDYIVDFRERTLDDFIAMGITEEHLRSESFALFLWVRPMHHGPGMWAPYSTIMAGTSAYTHRSPSTFLRTAAIEPNSPVSAAKVLYRGRAGLYVVEDDERGFRTWRSLLAVPLRMSEHNFDITKPQYELFVAAATLNSNFLACDRQTISEEPHAQTVLKPSVLSLMTPLQIEEVGRRIAEATTNCIVKLYKSGSTSP